jgi:hypothetical protein
MSHIHAFYDESKTITIERIGGGQEELVAQFDTDDYYGTDETLVLRDRGYGTLEIAIRTYVQIRRSGILRLAFLMDDGYKTVYQPLIEISKIGHRVTINPKNVVYPPPRHPLEG